jgi:predicted Fe-Mo cluster-binding NifX family protein
MKIILTASSPSIEANITPRFGRAEYLIVVDTDTLEWQAQPNPAVSAAGGAGTQVAQIATNLCAQAVISGDFGPNAYSALNAAGIAMYRYGTTTTVSEAIERFKAGMLESISAPSGRGHHGRR